MDAGSILGFEMEMEAINHALTTVNRVGMARTLPCLETIAVASVYGGNHSAAWSRRVREMQENREHLLFINGMFEFDVFLASGNLKHLCVRGELHPLGISPVSSTSDENIPDVRYSRTIHFVPGVDNLAIPVGPPIRWVGDSPARENWADSMVPVSESIKRYIRMRSSSVREELDYRLEPVGVEIYSSTRTFSPPSIGIGSETSGTPDQQDISVASQRGRCAIMGENSQAELRRTGRPDDWVRWYPSVDTPVCMACGSGVPDQS
ncbi:uncharacterized protein MKK02DRAFT_38492 [Dioszegia hungarica]|uniref:Uncharacterized protein n=1 Tax=Dioszegia hungarica TaxID=4972 RepID=A0AA38H474_9TREE|nr:uncharacterized protein MKK02DRAFT_38492 [Dioszegia hungarica]KAI9633831.1 hypothetical protein MKK02DRAFT_38492 [Dioszegia hungarica]